MIKNYISPLFCVLILLTAAAGCSAVYKTVYPTLYDGKYDSEFPYKNSSEQLEEIGNTIKLINSIAFYNSYIFDNASGITIENLKSIDPETKSKEKIYFNRTAAGTGTIVYYSHRNIALLTVAHIVNFPDTLISYFVKPDGTPSEFIQSISIKSAQSNYVPDLPDGGKLEILAMDKNNDVALLGKKSATDFPPGVSAFGYSWGKSSELEWGSFVYVIGYPLNYKMVSKGNVSLLPKEKNSFLIDAVFNRGFSGGIVLAIRDGVPNFELVGLVKSVPAEYAYTMRPLIKEHELDFNPLIPYKGDIYVDREPMIRFGITKVIGIETVIDFLNQHKEQLEDDGYLLPQFNK